MGKIVLNACFGGFSLSEAAMRLYAQKKGLNFYVWKDPKFDSDTFNFYFTADPSGMKEIDNDFFRKYGLSHYDLERDDPVLVEVVEELGDEANGMCAELVVEELEPGTLYRINEYDGRESIETADDFKWNVAK